MLHLHIWISDSDVSLIDTIILVVVVQTAFSLLP